MSGRKSIVAVSLTSVLALCGVGLLIGLVLVPAWTHASANIPSNKDTFDVHVLHSLSRVSPPTTSPKGDWSAYGVSNWVELANKKSFWIDLVQTNTTTVRKLTKSNLLTASEASPVWDPTGTVVAFSGDDATTIYQANVATGEVAVLWKAPVEITSFKFSPNGKFIVFSAKVYIDCPDPVLTCTAARQAAVAARGANTYFAYTQLYVRHWDTWETEGEYSHIFTQPIVPAEAGWGYEGTGAYVDLLKGVSTASPVPPFGGSEQYDISADGSEVSFTSEPVNHETAWRTGWQVWKVSTNEPYTQTQLSAYTTARCQDPEYSPDQKTIAYLCMDRPGLESDRLHIDLYNRADGSHVSTLRLWNNSVSAYSWGFDSDSFFIDTDEDGRHKIYLFRVSTGALTVMVPDAHNLGMNPAVLNGEQYVVFARDSMATPVDIWQFTVYKDKPFNLKQNTNYNENLVNYALSPGYEPFYFQSNGARVQGWILKPLNFDPTKKYPVAQLIHGGPEGAWLDNWSYRWNPQLWATAGFATFVINPHGSTGYGQAFQDAVRYDWGGVPFQDLMNGNDYVMANYPWADATKQTAAGASYGGFMINWINGNDNKNRFKALVCHDGLFSAMGMYYSSEEVFFNEAEFGPPPYTDAAARAMYEKFSPENFVQNWVTPTLIVHGGRDYRIPISEGLGAFTALQRKGIDSKLLHYPLENHWVLSQPNSIMWYTTVLDWMSSHTK